MKLQERKIGKYRQLYVTVPLKLAEALGWGKGTEVKWDVAGKDKLELRKV
ncbi:MAG: hypothetical protein GXO65_00720 [Euryarchaeota archaeon]|nr:hypothetical protein [Euryarchaeota archaeon]